MSSHFLELLSLKFVFHISAFRASINFACVNMLLHNKKLSTFQNLNDFIYLYTKNR